MKYWLAAAFGLLFAFIVAALTLPRSIGLTAISDIVQSALLLSGAVAFLSLAVRSRARIRLFALLISLGIAFWLLYQLFWTYYEIVLFRDVPDLTAWDAALFLHMVPLMAALALRPHVPRDEYAARVGQLDFALLLVWWFYLYVFVVMPWQYALPNIDAYYRNLNSVYLAEKLAFLVGLIACWTTSKGQWRRLYAGLFGSSICYSAGSTIANWAIARKSYYSGSLYDVPIVAAMAWLTWIGLRTKVEKPDSDSTWVSTTYGVWVARVSMIAVFSLPLFAAWAISETMVPQRIRVFRLGLTLIAAFFMGIMVFVRQRMLDRELVRLLKYSHESFDSLKRLQAQILQSEKLASITQLVGGAAHELNNPITAMLGYSDLLLNTPLTAEQKPFAVKIGQFARRTKSLVASLISFARPAPSPKTAVDLNTLARTAVKLTEPQWQALEIEVRTELDSALPKVSGDSNQLLQVCLQLLANCLHVISEHGAKVLTVSSTQHDGICVLQIATEAVHHMDDSGKQIAQASDVEGFGLSACQGILQEHRGQICYERRMDGAVLLRVELPLSDSIPANTNETKKASLPALWQSRPYA